MIYRQSEEIVTRTIAGEHLLVPVKGDLADLRQLFTLNRTGLCLWNALPATEDQLVTKLTKTFVVAPSTARQDTQALLSSLLDRKLIVACES